MDEFCGQAGVTLVKTKIGSPHVIAALKEAGWEGNGGFLTGTTISIPGGGPLAALPTTGRPASHSLCAVGSMTADTLPQRFGRSAVLRDFPMDAAQEIVQWLTPSDPAVDRRFLHPDRAHGNRADGSEQTLESRHPLAEEIGGIRAAISRYFVPADGFD